MNLDMNRIIELSKDLIRYKSFTGMERDIGGYISNFFKNAGIEYSIFEKERGRPNIIANIGNGEKTIALSGHFDVVPIANENLWEMNPFAPEVKENRLYGRGSYDMKASCAVMMHIAEIFSKENLKGNLQICLVSDEEKGAEFGTKYIIDLIKKGEIKKPDFAIVGEGSDLKIRNGERGIFVFKIIFKGKAGHTSTSRTDDVNNAIILASKAVLAIDKKIDKFHPEIGEPVISVNKILGGETHNQVPGECSITVDRRTIPGETKEIVMTEIQEQLSAVLAKEDFEIIDIHYDAANITPKDSPFINTVYKTVKDIIKTEPEFYVGTAGVTDAPN